MIHTKNKIYEFKDSDLEPRDSFKIRNELNRDVWKGFDIKKDIKEKLIEISNEFINNIYGDFTVYDIILIGSLASYNWSRYSDFDVHIVVDYSDINDDVDLVEKYLDLMKKKFNSDYQILIKGYEVELYVEDKNIERDHVNGIYSILKGKWIKRPTSNDLKEVNIDLVEEKSISLMEDIDEVEESFEELNNEELKKRISKIWDKIKKLRKDGINSPEGEFSIGNLVFKFLRRNEYISKVISLKKRITEDKYSL